jgi:hypothetical protein
MIRLIAGDFTLDAAAGDMPRRTISGTAVPYNVEAVVSDGTSVIFRPGSLPVEGKAPRLFMYHDASHANRRCDRARGHRTRHDVYCQNQRDKPRKRRPRHGPRWHD